jgi:hypothetical protein
MFKDNHESRGIHLVVGGKTGGVKNTCCAALNAASAQLHSRVKDVADISEG